MDFNLLFWKKLFQSFIDFIDSVMAIIGTSSIMVVTPIITAATIASIDYIIAIVVNDAIAVDDVDFIVNFIVIAGVNAIAIFIAIINEFISVVVIVTFTN